MICKKYYFLFCSLFCILTNVLSQNESAIFAKNTIAANRTILTKNIISTVNKNLVIPLKNESSEEKWLDAFGGMELINYNDEWIIPRIHYAFDSIANRSIDFQRGILELIYTNFPNQFLNEAKTLMRQTSHPKIFAMSSEYLLQSDPNEQTKNFILSVLKTRFIDNEDAIIQSLSKRLQEKKLINAYRMLPDIFSKSFLPGNVIIYSLQRRNRDYPGIVIVRNKEGKFIRDSNEKIFNVPQLARSITNLPGYLTNGNTPQGIFRMYGFDVSASTFIGPTPNIQLTMPVETSLQHFMKDSTITDSLWTEEWYKKLLPIKFKNYSAFYESYYAGNAGRTEIIAHGTTIDPSYYKNKPFYPYIPSQGCLSTKEIWSATTGRRLQSDQQKLVNAIITAGGPDGYTVVIELDDKNQPVNINEILSFILKAESLK